MIELTEQILEREIAEICEAELGILDKRLAQIPDRKVSAAFEKKMKRLLFLHKMRYDVFFNTIGKRVAAIIICVVIAGTTTVMSVDALRDGLFELIEKVYTRFSEITFEPVQSTYSMPEVFEEYSITNIPEGFTLETDYLNEDMFIKEQEFMNGTHTIRFGQQLATKANFQVDTEGTTTETVAYGGKEILCFSNKGIQYALWAEGDYAFIIHSQVEIFPLPFMPILTLNLLISRSNCRKRDSSSILL